MNKTELILGAITIISSIMVLSNLPGGVFLAIISYYSLALFYSFFSFALLNGIRFKDIFKKEAYSNTNLARIVSAIVIGLAYMIILVELLSMLMSWNEFRGLLGTGLFLMILILIVYGFLYLRSKDKFYERIIIRSTIFGITWLVFYIVL